MATVQEVTLKAAPQARVSLAKFDKGTEPNFETWKKPVRMTTEVEEMRRDEQRRGKKPARRLKDSSKKHLLRGTVEAAGVQENMRYVILTPGPNDSYLVQPVGDWWHYKLHKDYATLNIDEAEGKMKERKPIARFMMRAGQDDMMEHEGGLVDTIDDDAKFEAGEGGDEDGEAEPMDFDEKVSDDDGDEGKAVEDISGDEKDEPKVDNNLGVGAEDEDDDEDLQVEGTNSELNEHGKELKSLLKEEMGQLEDDDDVDVSSDDENFFGDDGNKDAEEEKEKEKAAEELTGVTAAPEAKKKKKKNKRSKDDDSPNSGQKKKKAKTEGADGAEEQPTLTEEEIAAYVTSNDINVKQLVAKFKSRLQVKASKELFQRFVKDKCVVGERKILKLKAS